MRNIALRLRYDGSAYHGWQRQAGLPTVQQTVEDAIAKILGTSVHVTGCGRTDAGVHALRYCANFRSDCTIPIEKVPLALNARLPRRYRRDGRLRGGRELQCHRLVHPERIYL